MLHGVLDHVLTVDLNLIEPLSEVGCVLVNLVSEPNELVPGGLQVCLGLCGRLLLDLPY